MPAGTVAIKRTVGQRRACAGRRARPVQRLWCVVVVHAVLKQELAREGQEDQPQDVVGNAVEVEGLRMRRVIRVQPLWRAPTQALAPSRLQCT